MSDEKREKLESEKSHFIGRPIIEHKGSSSPKTEYVVTQFKVISKLDSILKDGAIVKVRQKRNYCLKDLSSSSQYRVRYEFVEGYVNASRCSISESSEASER